MTGMSHFLTGVVCARVRVPLMNPSARSAMMAAVLDPMATPLPVIASARDDVSLVPDDRYSAIFFDADCADPPMGT